jgi:NitT/TauT family transport system permease protein
MTGHSSLPLRDIGAGAAAGSPSAADSAGGAAMRLPPAARPVLLGALGALVLFLAVELLTRVSGISEEYLPHASSVVARLLRLLLDPGFLFDVLSTLVAWALGLSAAVLLGVAFGALLGLSARAYRIGLPIVNLMRPIPSVCIIPLAILVMGQGLSMKVLLVGYATIWPILINTIYGVQSADPIGIDAARCFGLPRTAVLRHIIFPAAAPMIFTGIRISASIGLVVLVSAELLAATSSGIGSFIFRASSSGGNMDAVLAGAVLAGVVGVVINASLGAADRRLFRWRGQKEND